MNGFWDCIHDYISKATHVPRVPLRLLMIGDATVSWLLGAYYLYSEMGLQFGNEKSTCMSCWTVSWVYVGWTVFLWSTRTWWLSRNFNCWVAFHVQNLSLSVQQEKLELDLAVLCLKNCIWATHVALARMEMLKLTSFIVELELYVQPHYRKHQVIINAPNLR